ncbi:hypothetical protein XENOCAPTIV_003886, partial [Xenoophorus captivus]
MRCFINLDLTIKALCFLKEVNKLMSRETNKSQRTGSVSSARLLVQMEDSLFEQEEGGPVRPGREAVFGCGLWLHNGRKSSGKVWTQRGGEAEEWEPEVQTHSRETWKV